MEQARGFRQIEIHSQCLRTEEQKKRRNSVGLYNRKGTRVVQGHKPTYKKIRALDMAFRYCSPYTSTNECFIIVFWLGCSIDGPESGAYSLVHKIRRSLFLPCCAVYEGGNSRGVPWVVCIMQSEFSQEGSSCGVHSQRRNALDVHYDLSG